jgi:hypothetical protein
VVNKKLRGETTTTKKNERLKKKKEESSLLPSPNLSSADFCDTGAKRRRVRRQILISSFPKLRGSLHLGVWP